MVTILILLLAVGVIAYPSFKATYLDKPKVLPETIDLDSVRDAVMEKQGWSLDRANAAREEYLRFLTLLQLKPGFMLVPWPNEEGQDDLDQFWHQHILDTAKYADDCNRLFGRMIHHNPHVVRGSGQETSAVEKTQRLYARTFGTGPYGKPVDSDFVSSCGACATAEASSSGHGDSSHGGSHSCGSHSCGGHGCGHGCGSGCGGH